MKARLRWSCFLMLCCLLEGDCGPTMGSSTLPIDNMESNSMIAMESNSMIAKHEDLEYYVTLRVGLHYGGKGHWWVKDNYYTR